MNTRYLGMTLNVILVLILAGCASGEGPAGGQPILPTELPSPTFSPTADSQATQAAESTSLAILTQDAQATSDAEVLAATAALKTQKVLDIRASATSLAAIGLTSTAETSQLATRQVESMAAEVQELYEAGKVGTTEGEYFRLPDFDESWAQMDYYQWYPNDKAAENFVLSADAYVSSASDNANWHHSACGVVFSLIDSENHDVVWIAMDGRAFLQVNHKNNPRVLEIKRWGDATKTDFKVHFTLVVYDKKITLYVNDQPTLNTYDGLLRPGMLANTLVSGTNKGYGTRCQMTNIDLWIFK